MKTISFKIDDNFYIAMQQEAKKNGLSISAWIRIFIIEALSKKEKIVKKLEALEVVDELSESNRGTAWSGSSGK